MKNRIFNAVSNAFLTAFLFLAISNTAMAQNIVWTDVSEVFNLPAGVKLFSGSRTSPVLKIWYLDINTKGNYTLKPYTTPLGRDGILTFATGVGAIAAVNGGYFDNTNGQIYSAVVQPGVVAGKNIAAVTRSVGGTSISFPITRCFWGMKDDRSMSMDWIYHFGNKTTDIYKYAEPIPNTMTAPAPVPNPANGQAYYELVSGIGGGPRLIRNGVDKLTYTQEVFWGSGVDSTSLPRTAIGYTPDGHVMLLVADGRQALSLGITLRETAQIMVGLGCTEVMNLDGGGSSQMVAKGNLVNRPEGATSGLRTLPAILCVVPADTLPLLPAPTFNKKIDSDNPDCRLMGTWAYSNITGYYGNAFSQYAYGGTGESYAEFVLRLPKAGVYRVDAWWTASTNRATDAPFVVYRQGGVDTVRVNQTVGGYKWNNIGTYTFKGDSTDKVVLTNKVAPTSVIVANALRITSTDTTLTGTQSVPVNAEDFSLSQNYPNPFNSSTKVEWRLNKPAKVRLITYDVLGRKLRTIVDDYYNPGSFSTNISMNDVPSGVYYYQLTTDQSTITKKMVLLK